MIPVDQTVSNPVSGNCHEACIASILEIPIEDVPTFASETDGAGHHWLDAFQEWLTPRGYSVLYVTNSGIAPRGYHIGSNGKHAVVALDGKAVHCPHRSRWGLGQSIAHWFLIVRHGEPLTIDAAQK